MKTVTIEASGGIGVVTVGQGPGLPILLVVHGAELDGTRETVRAEITRADARAIIAALLEITDPNGLDNGCAWCGS